RCPLALPPNSDRESEFLQTVMSALPPRADTCSATRDVRFGPKADSCSAAKRIAIRSLRRPLSAAMAAHSSGRPLATLFDLNELFAGVLDVHCGINISDHSPCLLVGNRQEFRYAQRRKLLLQSGASPLEAEETFAHLGRK